MKLLKVNILFLSLAILAVSSFGCDENDSPEEVQNLNEGNIPGEPDEPTPQTPGEPDEPTPQTPGEPDEPTPQPPGEPDEPTPQTPGEPDEPTPQTPGEPDEPTPEPEIHDCNPACQKGEVCDTSTGTCILVCRNGLSICQGQCINFALHHLESCGVCEPGYCDGDGFMMNGCEVNSMANDVHHCGACGHSCGDEETCENGVCTPICDEGKTYCDGVCKDFSAFHLETCDMCAEGFDNCDGNVRNGCEISILTDVAHCGACGHSCDVGESCHEGVCENTYSVHRRMVVDDENSPDPTLRVLDMPDGDNVLGTLSVYDYFQALGEQELSDGETSNTWYLLNFNDQAGWVDGFYTMDVCDSCEGRKAIDFAENYLWTPENQMCTHDYYGEIPNLTNGADTHGQYYNNNCANFVTAILMNVGLISVHYDHVKEVRQYCLQGKEGYKMIKFSDAKAGDIWMEKDATHSHTELVVGTWNNGTHLITLGSINYTSCGTDGVKTLDLAGQYQRVAYTDRVYEGDYIYVCSRQSSE